MNSWTRTLIWNQNHPRRILREYDPSHRVRSRLASVPDRRITPGRVAWVGNRHPPPHMVNSFGSRSTRSQRPAISIFGPLSAYVIVVRPGYREGHLQYSGGVRDPQD